MTAVLDGQGYVILEGCYGDDLSIVRAARQSTQRETETLGDAEVGLIDFLMRNRHGTPFEMVDFRFEVKAPIFVVREWQRHRIASYNEMSGRYVELPKEFYVPAPVNIRRQVGKPGAYRYEPFEDFEGARSAQKSIEWAYEAAWRYYRDLLALGVAREQARMVLPVGIFTRFTFKTNLRSLFNFVSLRSAPNAMAEIREYAVAIEELARHIVPVAWAAFEKNGRIAP